MTLLFLVAFLILAFLGGVCLALGKQAIGLTLLGFSLLPLGAAFVILALFVTSSM